MRYTSTRSRGIDCSFEEALTSGYAADGGLFVPRSSDTSSDDASSNLPRLTGDVLRSWSPLTYPALMQRVLRMFISGDEVTDEELCVVCEAALTGFVDPSHAVPIVPIYVPKQPRTTPHPDGDQNDSPSPPFYVSELFHGPTFCFKDLGMRAVIQLLSLFATKRNRAITLLVSTTGDTGPAAVKAVSDLSNNNSNSSSNSKRHGLLKIAVHYPHHQISDFQRKQLTTVVSDCVRVVAFEGGGDDMDAPIKRLLATKTTPPPTTRMGENASAADGDATAAATTPSLWTGVNSYNIVRTAVSNQQATHHRVM